MTNDPLEQLFIRTEQVEQEQRILLAKLILPYAGINPDTGEVYFKPIIDELNAKQKILIYMLCRLALSALPNTAFSNIITPKEIERETSLPGGTVRPRIGQLVEEKLVIKTGDGYSIPAAFLHRIETALPASES
jgi:hypothetical protein